MKLKNIALLDKEFLKTCMFIHKQDLPIKISYPLKKVIEILEKEEKTVETYKNDLIKKYGQTVLDESDNIIGYNVSKASKENQESYVKEMEELISIEFEIPIEKKFEIDINNDIYKDLQLSSEKITKLETLFEFKF